jgi:hypothetical protein
MSVLSTIVQHCKMHGLAIPSSIVGSTDSQTTQLLAILSEVLDDMVTESKFNVTTQQALFNVVVDEDQGALATLCPYGYQFAMFETFFDRTLMRPLEGPVTESEWQALKALPTTGTYYKFRIRQDHLLLYPAPTDTSSEIAFEYMSSWCVKSAAGDLQAGILADTDVFVFPENIVRKGMMYRWKQIKGLPYQADETRFWDMLNNYIAKDKVKRRINVGDPPHDIRPGIWVPSNSWMQ